MMFDIVGLIFYTYGLVFCGAVHERGDYEDLSGSCQLLRPVNGLHAGCGTSGSALERGTRLLNEGKPREALPLLQQAVTTSPSSALAQNNLGVAHSKLENSDLAKRHMQLAVKLEPSNPAFLANLGWSHTYNSIEQFRRCYPDATSDWNLAISAFENALALDPGLEEAYLGLSYCYGYTGESEKCITNAENVLGLSPESFIAHDQLSSAYIERNDYHASLRETR